MMKWLCKKGNKQLTVRLSLADCRVIEDNFQRGVLNDTRQMLDFWEYLKSSIRIFENELNMENAAEAPAVMPAGAFAFEAPPFPDEFGEDGEQV
jgi:hypothetical protein